jgi:hypothetical protein
MLINLDNAGAMDGERRAPLTRSRRRLASYMERNKEAR